MDYLKFIEKEFPDITGVKEIQQGGQKRVYTAIHKQHGQVVVKLILDVKNFERTLREIDLVQEKNFQRVPKIYEHGTKICDTKLIFIIEQLITGNTLRELIDKGGFQEKEAISYLIALLEICVQLENQSVVHRDIKPRNIIIDKNGELWLLDFGIARQLDLASLTPTMAPYGPHTLGYAAPEQIENLKKKIDIRADLFSVGVLVYEMINGENPFFASAINRLDVIRNTKNLSPEKLDLDLPKGEDLSALINSMIEKYPSRRPPSATKALEWLNKII